MILQKLVLLSITVLSLSSPQPARKPAQQAVALNPQPEPPGVFHGGAFHGGGKAKG